jgi:hypothetical protein
MYDTSMSLCSKSREPNDSTIFGFSTFLYKLIYIIVPPQVVVGLATDLKLQVNSEFRVCQSPKHKSPSINRVRPMLNAIASTLLTGLSRFPRHQMGYVRIPPAMIRAKPISGKANSLFDNRSWSIT